MDDIIDRGDGPSTRKRLKVENTTKFWSFALKFELVVYSISNKILRVVSSSVRCISIAPVESIDRAES